MAIYVRPDNLKVLDVYRSRLFRLLGLTLFFRMLTCGVYNPLKHKYRDADLMNYLYSFVDSVLDKHPDRVVLCGGDINRLDTKTRISLNNRDRLKLANSRKSQDISENRGNPASVMGSRVWWKNVHLLHLVSQRRATTTCVNFDHASLDHLKDYFGRLCHDDSYVRRLLMWLSRGMWKFQRQHRRRLGLGLAIG